MQTQAETKGFTLVELLVVMAILAVLIALSLAGMGYALRRSRNIDRQAAVENMVVGAEAYYSEHREYFQVPPGTFFSDVFGPQSQSGQSTFLLEEFLQSNFDAPPESMFFYMTDVDMKLYTICVNQEVWNNNPEWICDGTGVGAASFPPRENPSSQVCPGCGNCGEWNGTAWEGCTP